MKQSSIKAFCLLIVMLALCGITIAQTGSPLFEQHFSMVSKAKPDECFAGIGQIPGELPCEDGQEKTNQAYIWSICKPEGDEVWFGTNANTLCEVFGGILENPETIATDDFVCEFGDSPYSPPWTPANGDWRAPQIFTYNKITGLTVDQTTKIDEEIETTTLGWRASATIDNIVFFGGPGRGDIQFNQGYVKLVAFDAATGEYIGGTTLAPYTNIRQLKIAKDGNLYAGVKRLDTIGGKQVQTGRIIKWINDKNYPGYPFAFQEVGSIASEAANINEYNGRLYVTTWPTRNAQGVMVPFGVWRSPVIMEGGLTPFDLNKWEQVWNYAQYDPDPIHRAITGGGDLMALDGWLYFGTMHVPSLQASVGAKFGAKDSNDLMINGHRAISIFRLREISGPTKVETELLWGRSELSKFDAATATYGSERFPTGYTPLYGDWGMGNYFNNYTWTLEVVDGWLYVGTMDWSYLAESLAEKYYKARIANGDLISIIFGIFTKKTTNPEDECKKCPTANLEFLKGVAALWDDVNQKGQKEAAKNKNAKGIMLPPGSPIPLPGFDIFSTNGEAWLPVTSTGFNNYTSYGVRNLMADGKNLFVGTANPMNLHKLGGWELWVGNTSCSKGKLEAPQNVTCSTSGFQITLTDCDLNTSSTFAETVTVYAYSKTETNPEVITLTESGPDTYEFIGTVPVNELNVEGDGAVTVSDNDTVTVFYVDTMNDEGKEAYVYQEVNIDCVPPVISNVKVVNSTPGIAIVTFDTNELTFTSVGYGLTCGSFPESSTDGFDSYQHTVPLTDIDTSTTYKFAIMVRDYAGNITVDDNNGECYSFTTILPCDMNMISLSTPVISCDSTIGVIVADCDSNTSATKDEWINVQLTAYTPEGDVYTTETISLQEMGFNAGTFSNGIQITPDENLPNDGKIQAIDGGTLVASYIKEGVEEPIVSEAGVFDCTPPEIYNVETEVMSSTAATITFKMTELGTAYIDYGTSCGVYSVSGQQENNIPMFYSHTIDLNGLTPNTTYYFRLLARELPSNNYTINDNDEQCFSFTTLPEYNCSRAEIYFDSQKNACEDIVNVTVYDCDKNTSDTVQDQVTVYITSSDAASTTQTIVLNEMEGYQGTFSGSFGLTDFAPDFVVNDGDTLTVSYEDKDDGTGNAATVSDSTKIDCTPPDINVKLVQVLDSSAVIDVSISEPGTIQVDYGTTCGLFSNSYVNYKTATSFEVHLDNLTSGTLYYYQVTAWDELNNGAVNDNQGSCFDFITSYDCSQEDIFLDKETYLCDSTVNVVLQDCNYNLTPSAQDTALVQMIVRNASNVIVDTEMLTLTETENNSGIFSNSCILTTSASPQNDGKIQVEDNSSITAGYYNNGLPELFESQPAVIDCTNPGMVSNEVINITETSARINFIADEPVTVELSYGTACGVEMTTISSDILSDSHSFDLTGLTPDTIYYFSFTMTDQTGINTTIVDNDGACFSFRTKSFVYEWTFDSDNDGWTTGAVQLAPATNFPTFGWADGALTIGPNGMINFGFWQSPVNAIPEADGNSLYKLTATLKTDIPQSQVPVLRLRTNALNFAQGNMLILSSVGDAQNAPTSEPVDYSLYYQPQGLAIGQDFLIAVDLLNIETADAEEGNVMIDNVEVVKMPLTILTNEQSEKTYTFDESAEGWTDSSSLAYMTSPVFEFTTGTLQMTSVNNTDTFGFWNNNPQDISVGEKLYRATFSIQSSLALTPASAIMRGRMFSEDFQSCTVFESQLLDKLFNQPVKGLDTPNTYDFNVFFTPPAYAIGSEADGLGLAIDLLNINPTAPEEFILGLDALSLESYDVPNPVINVK